MRVLRKKAPPPFLLLLLLLFPTPLSSFIPSLRSRKHLLHQHQLSSSSSSSSSTTTATSSFFEDLETSLESGTFRKLTLSVNGAENAVKELGADGGAVTVLGGDPLQRLRNVYGRVVELKKKTKLQLTLRYAHRDVVRNVDLRPSDVRPALESLLGGERFRRGRIFTSQGDTELKLKPNGKARLQRLKPSLKQAPQTTTTTTTSTAGDAMVASHDRRRAYAIDPLSPFLGALGVTSPEDGRPRAGMASKLRQIQKFIETIDRLVAVPAPSGRLRIVDVGCGRGYLTFAAHAHFAAAAAAAASSSPSSPSSPSSEWSSSSGAFSSVETRGVEVRQDLVDETNGIAQGLGADFRGLRFEQSAIADYLSQGSLSTAEKSCEEALVLIALHACDTATDDALWAGIRNDADAIITAPCCHKEVRRQLNAFVATGGVGRGEDEASASGPSGHPLGPLLRFGTYRERAAEMATDAMRALLLEIAQYDVQVFEFIGGEHTAKNVMIAATKRAKRRERSEGQLLALRRELRDLMALHGVERQRLAEWMGEIEEGGVTGEDAATRRRRGKGGATYGATTPTGASPLPPPPPLPRKASPRSFPKP